MDATDFFQAEDAAAARRTPNGNAPWDAGEDDPIPPRGWLLGNQFCREFMSGISSPGGTGKTALRLVQFLALTTGRPLSGDHVFHRCRVLVVSLEDGRDELRRRLRAAMLHHDVSADDIRGRLFLWTPSGIKLAEMRE